jgi:AcrR family transcriptional regulator
MARRREFDEDTLLDRSTSLFWKNGYGATSMSDVAASSGVGNGSIYAAYGSKPELFLLVFDRYCHARVDIVRHAMGEGGDAGAAVGSLLEAVIEDCAEHTPSWGCLMLNTVAEVGRQWPEVVAIARRAIGEMESVVDERLAREGIPEAGRALIAAEIILVSQGIIQFSRVEGDTDRLRGIASSWVGRLAPALKSA